ncbi:MAG: alanine racemase [Betaproteobacteria bacterium]|nr:alanine racemase [Betaproteobacteria bacterium]
MEANVARLKARLAALGVRLRPHVKTCKSFEVARLLMEAPTGPITVSTLKEAEQFLEHGVTDILYAVGIAPGKLDHVRALRDRGADLAIVVDSVEAAQAVAARGEGIPALIEIDCDGHRAGVKPGDAILADIAKALARGAQPRGVMTHAGGSYDCRSTGAIAALAERERAAVVESAAVLRAAGFDSPVVSVGSTPTATFAANLEGVTEVRAGVFVFHDLVMAGLGVCAVDDIALSVLATVIGHQREKGWIVTDAGWMAMSRDRGTGRQAVDQGYGLVCDEAGRVIGDLVVSDANQEHGIVSRRDAGPLDVSRYPVGTRLRILPNHACATGAQHDAYHVVRGGPEVLARWPRFGGW